MYEAYTFDFLMADVLKHAPEGIDTRQGSIFYDATAAVCLKIAKLYTDLDTIAEMTTIATATGEALDAKAAEKAVYRLAATRAKYLVSFEGVTPDVGERFYYDGAYFTLRRDDSKDDKGVYYLEAETPGESGNNIYQGTPAVPVNNIEGLEAATFGAIYENGSDEEGDEALRTRVIEKIAGPAENGNVQHYKTWCEEVDGVGRARITPLWLGENTIKAVLIDPTGRPCGEAKVAEVQRIVDPADKGMTVVVDGKTYVYGDGLGNGKANVGAHLTVTAATPLNVVVSFKAELAAGATAEAARTEAANAIEDYLRGLVLDTKEDTDVVVRISAIGAILSGLKNLVDYSDLELNGRDANLVPGPDDVPVLEEVKLG